MRHTFLPFALSAVLLCSCSAKAPRQAVTHPDISVQSPAENAVVQSPLVVSGQARGTWFFEASFPVQLVDSKGNELATAVAQAQDDWMTAAFVPFTATLEFQTTDTEGTLILRKDNPSGAPENDAKVEVPVKFQ